MVHRSIIRVNEAEFRRVFTALVEDRAEEIVVNDEIENGTNFKLIVELAEKNRLPAIYAFKFYVQAGGLMSYGIDFPAVGNTVANMVDRILKGEKPSGIPAFLPTKFELAIRRKRSASPCRLNCLRPPTKSSSETGRGAFGPQRRDAGWWLAVAFGEDDGHAPPKRAGRTRRD